MKIKPPSRKHLQRKASKAYRYWEVELNPKSNGRTSSLGKFHRRNRAKHTSEFVTLAGLCDNPDNRNVSRQALIRKARGL